MARNQANLGAKEQAAERRLFVLERRKAGASIREIEAAWEKYCNKKNAENEYSKYDSVSHTQIWKDLKTSLKELRSNEYRDAEDLRQLEAVRLDGLQVQFWIKAMGQYDPAQKQWLKEPDVQAGKLLLAVMKRRAELFGLDMPQKIDHSGEIKNVQMTVNDWRKEVEKRRLAAAETQEVFEDDE